MTTFAGCRKSEVTIIASSGDHGDGDGFFLNRADSGYTSPPARCCSIFLQHSDDLLVGGNCTVNRRISNGVQRPYPVCAISRTYARCLCRWWASCELSAAARPAARVSSMNAAIHVLRGRMRHEQSIESHGRFRGSGCNAADCRPP